MTLEIYKEGESVNTENVLTHIPERYKPNPNTFAEKSGTINIGSRESDPNTRVLSNFAETPFILDGIRYTSVEGFIQSLKSSEATDQMHISTLAGYQAKKTGASFKEDISESYRKDPSEEEPVGYVTNYQGYQIPYRSPEHYALIERAIRAKFEQNDEALRALVGDKYNERALITHKLRRPDGSIKEESSTTSLPAEVFTSILMNLRHEKQMEYWKQSAKKNGEHMDYYMRRYFFFDLDKQNPDILYLIKLGYKYASIAYLKSLTPKEMRYGTFTEAERIAMAKKFAGLANIDDLTELAKEAGLVNVKKKST